MAPTNRRSTKSDSLSDISSQSGSGIEKSQKKPALGAQFVNAGLCGSLRRLNLTGLLRRIPSASEYISHNAKFNSSPLLTHYGDRILQAINDKVLGKRALNKVLPIRRVVKKELDALNELTRQQREELSIVETFLSADDFVEFIRDSVRGAPMGAIDPAWLRKMCKGSSAALRARFPKKSSQLLEAVGNQYMDTVHENQLANVLSEDFRPKSIWEFNVQWPLSAEPVPWKGLVARMKTILNRKLLLLHPIVYSVFRKASDLLGRECLIDFEALKKIRAMKPQHVKELMVNNIRAKGQELIDQMDNFLFEVFITCPQLSKYVDVEKTRVLKCIENIIVVNARQLFLNTITELLYAYENPMESLPRFIIEVTMEKDNRINYYPRYHEFMYCIRKVYEAAFEVVNSIPHAERFFTARVSASKVYEVDISHEFIESTRTRISEIVDEWMVVPKKLIIKLNNKYGALINGEAQQFLEKYMDPNMNFYEALSQLRYFVDYGISCYEIPAVIYYNNLQFVNEEVCLELLETANFFYFALLEYLVARFRDHNSKIIHSFEHIRQKLVQVPKSTEELMKLSSFIDYARGELLPILKDLISEGVRQHFALLDVYILGVDELEMAARVQTWHRDILPVFQKNAIMLEDTREKLEDNVTKAIADTRADIKKLHRRVSDDFYMNGNYEECHQYLHEVKYIEDRIQTIRDRIGWINNEETLMKFVLTTFPELDDVINDLKPYQDLWMTCVKWQRMEKKYMDGEFNLNVTEVDAQTNELLAEIVRLQTLFKDRIRLKMQAEADRRHVPLSFVYVEDSETDVRPPLKICLVALSTINKFRENIRFIGILCNPSLRQRHWEQMSEIFGQNLTPNAGSSLRKYLSMHMEDFYDKFEEVSVAASKEYARELAMEKNEFLGEWEGEEE